MSREKLLIIKTGYSETLDPELSGTVSLGDVFRSTVLLHAFPQSRYEITWVTDPLAWPLLRGNELIDNVIKINPFTPFHLQRSFFDVVVNLEKDPGICALADSIPAWKKFGFRYDPRTDRIAGHAEAKEAIDIALDPHLKQRLGRNWSEMLFDMVGAQWQGENYVLGHHPRLPVLHDVAFNYRVGSKFPLKSWPTDYWHALGARCEAAGLSVAWQPAQDNVEEIERYIDWIAGCGLLVTNDSLGLHLAIALNKPVVALFGPTSHADVPRHPLLTKVIEPGTADCTPCSARSCVKSRPCMELLSVDSIFEKVQAHHARRSATIRHSEDAIDAIGR
jgi:heptosyltransferase-2